MLYMCFKIASMSSIRDVWACQRSLFWQKETDFKSPFFRKCQKTTPKIDKNWCALRGHAGTAVRKSPPLPYFNPYTACFPNASSMRKSRLYLQILSVRLREPVFICPTLVATAKSAKVVSSVSPERCDTIHL